MKSLMRYGLIGSFCALISACAAPSEMSPAAAADQDSSVAEPLRAPAEFAGIRSRDARSIAIFTEAARVIQSPRCLNCHPVTRTPTQGEDMHPHVPFLEAGEAGHGPAGLACATCHQGANVATYSQPIATIPGNEHWALAPSSMAWQGRSMGEICEQIKDAERNGGRSLAQIHTHMAEDSLVGWAWHPGEPRKPAPGTQAAFGALIEAWIATGASCPSS